MHEKLRKSKGATLQLRKLKSGNTSFNIYYNKDRNYIKTTGITVPTEIIGKDKYIKNPNSVFNWEETEEINNILRTELNKVNKAIHELNSNHTITDLENHLDPNIEVSGEAKKEQNLSTMFDIFIAHNIGDKPLRTKYTKREPLKKSTLNNYRSTQRVLNQFSKDVAKELTFEYLYGDFWDDFRYYMYENGNIDSNIDTYFKDINAVMQYVQFDARVLDLSLELRNQKLVRLKDEDEDIIFLLPDELKILANMKFDNAVLDKTRDIFLFQKENMLRVSEVWGLTESDINKIGDQFRVDIYSPKRDSSTAHYQSRLSISILEKWGNKLPTDITTNQYNINLKNMAKALGKYMNTPKIVAMIAEYNLFTRDLSTYKQKVKANIEVTEDGVTSRKVKRIKLPIVDLLSSHHARKSGICEMILAKEPRETIMKKSGHSKDSKAFSRYYEVMEEWMNIQIVAAQNLNYDNSQKMFVNKEENEAA